MDRFTGPRVLFGDKTAESVDLQENLIRRAPLVAGKLPAGLDINFMIAS